MKNKRKFTAIFAAAALAAALTTTVFASSETIDDSTKAASKSVTGSYTAASSTGTVYRVDVTWGDTSFTYTQGEKGSWDPATHSYADDVTGSWSGGTDITVANHSNAAVDATFGFTPEAAFDGKITGAFTAASGTTLTGSTLSLASADAGESLNNFSKAPKGEVAFSLSGDPGPFTNGTTLGTITLSFK